jgi:hypothetical protein
VGMAMEDPHFLVLLDEAQASSGLIDEGLAAVTEALGALLRGRDFSIRPSCIGCWVRYRCTRLWLTRRGRKLVSSKPWKLPAASRRNRWSCGRQ